MRVILSFSQSSPFLRYSTNPNLCYIDFEVTNELTVLALCVAAMRKNVTTAINTLRENLNERSINVKNGMRQLLKDVFPLFSVKVISLLGHHGCSCKFQTHFSNSKIKHNLIIFKFGPLPYFKRQICMWCHVSPFP